MCVYKFFIICVPQVVQVLKVKQSELDKLNISYIPVYIVNCVLCSICHFKSKTKRSANIELSNRISYNLNTKRIKGESYREFYP